MPFRAGTRRPPGFGGVEREHLPPGWVPCVANAWGWWRPARGCRNPGAGRRCDNARWGAVALPHNRQGRGGVGRGPTPNPLEDGVGGGGAASVVPAHRPPHHPPPLQRNPPPRWGDRGERPAATCGLRYAHRRRLPRALLTGGLAARATPSPWRESRRRCHRRHRCECRRGHPLATLLSIGAPLLRLAVGRGEHNHWRRRGRCTSPAQRGVTRRCRHCGSPRTRCSRPAAVAAAAATARQVVCVRRPRASVGGSVGGGRPLGRRAADGGRPYGQRRWLPEPRCSPRAAS